MKGVDILKVEQKRTNI